MVLAGVSVRLPVDSEDSVDCAGVHAADIHVGQSARFENAEITGSGSNGAVLLRGARIAGKVSFRDATLRNKNGPALSADHARLERGLLLDGTITLDGHSPCGAVQLRNVRLGDYLTLTPTVLAAAEEPERQWAVDGLTYVGTPAGVSVGEWERLLRHGSTGYAAQAYRHFAAALTAARHDRDARRILITQRRHELDEPSIPRSARVWGRFTWYTLGFGYQPWRALLGIAALTLLSIALTLGLGGNGLIHTSRSPAGQGTPCSWPERIGYALDGIVPVVRTGARDACVVDLNISGTLIQLGGWMLGLLIWAFVTLFVAGFTNAIRKT